MFTTIVWVFATWTAVHVAQAAAQPTEPFSIVLNTCANDLHPSQKVLEIMFLLDASASNTRYLDVFDVSYQKVLDMLEGPYYTGSRVGVGSFIDKPYVSSSDYCYRNVHSLTNEISEVRDAVHEIPRGEGSDELRRTALDSLYYSAKRGVTGWSPFSATAEGQRIIKVAFIFTNGYYETAGRKTVAPDGQAIYPNQKAETYDCVHEDYPSVEQTAEQLLAMDIHPIFLVSSSVNDQFGETILQDFDQYSVPVKVFPVVQSNPRDILEAIRLALNDLICSQGHSGYSKREIPLQTVGVLTSDAKRDKDQMNIENDLLKSKESLVPETEKEVSESTPGSERAPSAEGTLDSKSVSVPESAPVSDNAAVSEDVSEYESASVPEDVRLSEPVPLSKEVSSANGLPSTSATSPDGGSLSSPTDSSARSENEHVPIAEPKEATKSDNIPSREAVQSSASVASSEAPSVPSAVSEEPSLPVEVAQSAPMESEAPYGWCSC